MSEITWTAEELAEFDKLVDMASSLRQRQMDRIYASLDMPQFIARHGKEKYDAVRARLEGSKK